MKVAALVLTTAALLACGPVPGGSLEGRVTPLPQDWATALPEGRAFCEIESRPADPHSIQLDCFLYGSAVYVQSHRWALASWWPVDSWAAIWQEHPDVRVRVGDAIFPVRAVRVTDPSEREPILRSRGYEEPPQGIVVFRFDSRV